MGVVVAEVADPVLLVLAAVGVTWLAAAVAAALAVALGDDTPRRAGLHRRPWRLLDRTGSVLVPALMALAATLVVAWPARLVLARTALSPGRRVAVAAARPVTAITVAWVAAGLGGVPTTGWSAGLSGGVTDAAPRVVTTASPTVHLVAVAVVLAVVWSLPLPPLSGGAVVGVALEGTVGERWRRWQQLSPLPWLLPVAVGLAALPPLHVRVVMVGVG